MNGVISHLVYSIFGVLMDRLTKFNIHKISNHFAHAVILTVFQSSNI